MSSPSSPEKSSFVHLRLHSEFSVVDGTVRLDEVSSSAAKDGQGALALTDFNNLFGVVKFYKSTRGAGVKPIVGVELLLDMGAGETAKDQAKEPVTSRIVLLAQNKTGYLNLCELISRGWTQNAVRANAVCKLAWLQELSDGLILLSGAQAGPLGAALLQGDGARANELALQLTSMFPHRFYIELQRAGRADDEAYVVAAVKLAAQCKLPVVATHPVQFLQREDYEAHEARICISEGEILGNARRVRKFTREQYFKSSEEMAGLFADLPSALANTLEIAKRCNVTLELGKSKLPNFPTPLVNGQQLSADDYFRHVSHEGLKERMLMLYPDAAEREKQMPTYLERLEFEMGTILKMGFPGYFLIVGDFIQWAKANGCPVGPGRGSGAGSLVAYAMKITDLDPLQYKLLFERFLNPDRVSMPDFDIDFCQANRDRVIDYVKAKYGKDAVSQIVTFGTMAARAAVRDVGRVMDMSYTFCDGISKLIPNKPGQHITLDGALKAEPVFQERYDREEEVRTLVDMAQKLEGMTRNVGMHAGGVLIAPGKLTDFCPLYQQPGSDSAVSQYDKDDVEAVGLVKFDFLGLATLTILELAKDFIVQRHPGQKDFSFEAIPLNDAHTYKLFADGKTEAVFQFESRGMQGMLRDAKPTRLEDLIALNALYRPGPMDLIPSFVARKHGREEIEYPHPLVAEMLSETYGIMVYQEQVMQTAQILGGYSLGGADLLRRAMGKKKAEEMAEHRVIFRAGAEKNAIPEAKADEIFDLMEKFAGYGFNKSHAAAYSLLAYHTGWLKRHFTAEFFCANMTIEMDNTDKLKMLFEDATNHFGLTFEPPDVNRGLYRFEPVSDKVIRYGLGAVKGSGQQAVEAIIAARQDGLFTSLFDFCARVERSKINKRTVEALVKAGAFDSLHLNRAALMASVDLAMDFAETLEANANQGGLFDMMDSHAASTQEPPLVEAMPWGVKERLSLEKTAVGFFLSGHLFDESERELRQFVKLKVDDLMESREPRTVCGIVSDMRVINGQRGKLAIFKIDDKSGVIEATADEALINANKLILKDDELLIFEGKVQPDRFSGGLRMQVNRIWDIPAARAKFGRYLKVAVNGKAPDLERMVREFPPKKEETEQGTLLRGLPVRYAVWREGEGLNATAEIELGERAKFFPSDAALASWIAQAHAGNAQIVYNA
jgi:DNA polymerase III subunit alpha